jgi:hypothetical protein
MVAPKTLHSVEAISCSVRIEPDTPRAVLVVCSFQAVICFQSQCPARRSNVWCTNLNEP